MGTTFLQDLVKSNLDICEPYFFYLMLFWPTDISKNNEVEIFTCLNKLRQLEDIRENLVKSRGDVTPIRFILGEGDGTDKILPFDVKNRKRRYDNARRFTGKLDGHRNVDIPLRSGRNLKIPLRDAVRFREDNKFEEITFIIGFSFGGPVALDYEIKRFKDEKDAINERIEKNCSFESLSD